MKIYLRLLVFFAVVITLLVQCSKKTSIGEDSYGTYEFTTYTIDTFRFRVVLDGAVLSDSLLSPQSSVSKLVKFQKSSGRLQIIDAGNNDQVVLDSIIPFKIGKTKISLVQFQHHQKPTTSPVPNEPPPAAGNYKIRFQYVKPKVLSVPYFDSVRFYLRKNGIVIDTITLKKMELSKFYEASLSSNFSLIRFESPTGTLIGNGSLPTTGVGTDFTEAFSTAIIYGSDGTAVPNYRFDLAFAY